MSMLAPASAGVPGPGEMTMPAGPKPATSRAADLVVADHLDLASLPEQQMGQVVGERVVVVDQDDRGRAPPCASRKAVRATWEAPARPPEAARRPARASAAWRRRGPARPSRSPRCWPEEGRPERAGRSGPPGGGAGWTGPPRTVPATGAPTGAGTAAGTGPARDRTGTTPWTELVTNTSLAPAAAGCARRLAGREALLPGEPQHRRPGDAGQQPPVRGRGVQDPVDHREHAGPVGLQHLAAAVVDQELLIRAGTGRRGEIGQQAAVQPLVRAESARKVTGRSATVPAGAGRDHLDGDLQRAADRSRGQPEPADGPLERQAARSACRLGGRCLPNSSPRAVVQPREVPAEAVARGRRSPGAR